MKAKPLPIISRQSLRVFRRTQKDWPLTIQGLSRNLTVVAQNSGIPTHNIEYLGEEMITAACGEMVRDVRCIPQAAHNSFRFTLTRRVILSVSESNNEATSIPSTFDFEEQPVASFGDSRAPRKARATSPLANDMTRGRPVHCCRHRPSHGRVVGRAVAWGQEVQDTTSNK